MIDAGQLVEVTSEAELRDLLGTPLERTVKKERQSLHPHNRAWIARSPFCLIATAGPDGTCDVSPKGDPPRIRPRAGRHHAGHPGAAREPACRRLSEHPAEPARGAALPGSRPGGDVAGQRA